MHSSVLSTARFAPQCCLLLQRSATEFCHLCPCCPEDIRLRSVHKNRNLPLSSYFARNEGILKFHEKAGLVMFFFFLSLSLSLSLSLYLSICLSIVSIYFHCLSVSVSVRPSSCLCLELCLSVHLFRSIINSTCRIMLSVFTSAL